MKLLNAQILKRRTTTGIVASYVVKGNYREKFWYRFDGG